MDRIENEYERGREWQLVQSEIIAQKSLLFPDHLQVPELSRQVTLFLFPIRHANKPVFVIGREIQGFHYILAGKLIMIAAIQKIFIKLIGIIVDQTP